jgi:hypothetical protein
MIHDIGMIGYESHDADDGVHHALVGYEILKNIRPLGAVADIVRLHHGPGIASGLSALDDNIVFAARIVACAEYLCPFRHQHQDQSPGEKSVFLNWLGEILDTGRSLVAAIRTH